MHRPLVHRLIAMHVAAAATIACGGGGGSSGNATATALPALDVSAVAAADPGRALPADRQQDLFAEIGVRGCQA